MAVPKQKQSHSRTSKRRAQHKISAPTYNACPTCHSPRLPHRVCPVCGTYAGREVIEHEIGEGVGAGGGGEEE
jgi:large subunit ribosomal protein L32